MIKFICTTLFCMTLLTGCSANVEESSSLSVASEETAGKVSRFGEYKGYSERKYDSYVRESRYVATRDGTRLAVDIYYPAMGGERAQEPLPVILTMNRYWRSRITPAGEVKTVLDNKTIAWRMLSEHGYIVVMADMRGSGASFGQDQSGYSIRGSQDTYDILEWVALQPWSNGKAGMLGGSYLGGTQLTAVGQHPPSLKAIFPKSIGLDLKQNFGSGGAFRKVVSLTWLSMVDILDGIMDPAEDPMGRDRWKKRGMVAPVDGQDGARLLAEAREDHRKLNEDFRKFLSGEFVEESGGVYRSDFVASFRNYATPGHYLPEINSSNIPVYYFGGWYDAYADAALLWHRNLTVPKKIVNGPWTHGPNEKNDPCEDAARILYAIEALRWYDYWLKDIDNGIMDEPSLRYAVIGKDPHTWAWRTVNKWPDRQVENQDFYLGKSGDDLTVSAVKSVSPEKTSFVVDYTATTGKHTRYYDTMGSGPLHYPEMSDLNSKGLAYTSMPMDKDMVIAGYPVITLNVASTAADGEFNVYLEKVTPDGKSHFVTEGVMRASRRVLGVAPYDLFDLPMEDGRKEVVEATPPLNKSGVVTLTFYLQPIGIIFEKGSRLRIAITGADADFSFQKPVSPAPTHTIFTGGNYATKISLPLFQNPDQLSYKIWVYKK